MHEIYLSDVVEVRGREVNRLLHDIVVTPQLIQVNLLLLYDCALPSLQFQKSPPRVQKIQSQLS